MQVSSSRGRVASAERPGHRCRAFLFLLSAELVDLEVHTTHAAHAAAWRHAGAARILLRHFGDHGFGGDQKRRNRRRVLDRHANHLGRVDDALGDQVAVFAGLRVKAVGILILLQDLADDHRAVFASIDRDLTGRIGQRLAHDLDAGLLVVVLGAKPLEVRGGTQQSDAAARHDAFLNRRTGCMHRVINAIPTLPHLDFSGAADADHRDAARELGQALLQLLTVVVRGGFLDLRLDLVDPCLDVGLLASPADDGGVFLVDHHLLGATEHGERDVLELDAEIFRDRLTTGQNCDVLQHGLASIAEAGSLDRRNLQPAAQTVDDESGESLAFDVFRNNYKRLAALNNGFQKRKQFIQLRQLLFIDEDVGVFHFNAHLVGVGDEVGRDVAAVELHAFDDLKLGLERLGFFNRDHALVADLLHGVGKELADFRVAVGRDGADLSDFLVRGDLLGVLDEVGDHGVDRQVDTAFQIHRVHAGGNRLGAFPDDRSRQHGRGGGAVAGSVGRLGGHFAHHLRAHVLELVLKLDFFGDGDAVLGDAGCAERLVEHDVAALRTERDLHRVVENVDAAQHPVTGIDAEFDFFG